MLKGEEIKSSERGLLPIYVLIQGLIVEEKYWKTYDIKTSLSTLEIFFIIVIFMMRSPLEPIYEVKLAKANRATQG